MKKFGAALFVAAVSMLNSTPASATAVCTDINSINEWQDNYSVCEIGDKRFTLIDTDLDLTPYTSDFAIEFLQSGLAYSFIGDGNITGGGDFQGDNEYVTYRVDVLDPSFRIVGVSLDSTVSVNPSSATATTVIKTIRDLAGALLDSLTSTDGSTDTSVALFHSSLVITDTISVALGDTLSSFTNVLSQSPIPEPASMFLLGTGLLGLAAKARSRQARKSVGVA